MTKAIFLVAIALILICMHQFLPELRIALGQSGRLIAVGIFVLIALPVLLWSQKETEEQQNNRF